MSSTNIGVPKIIQAANFAAVKHRFQRRKDPEKTPYINHAVGVAHLLVTVGKITDVDTLAAALLHDTVEDTETTFEEIDKEFGTLIRTIVAEVTDDKSLPKEERKQLQIINAANRSPQAKLIKLADKLYNLQDLLRATPEGWSEERVQQYFEWAAKVVERLLGINEGLEEKLKEVFAVKGIKLQ